MYYRSGMNAEEFFEYLVKYYQLDIEEIIKNKPGDFKDELITFQMKLRFLAMVKRHNFLKSQGNEAFKKMYINGIEPLSFLKNEIKKTRLAQRGWELILSFPYLAQMRFFADLSDLSPFLTPIRIMPRYAPKP